MKVWTLQNVPVVWKISKTFSYEYDGVRYVTFEVAIMKQADNFGRDYTLYVSKKEESEEAERESKKASKKTKKSKRELEHAGKEREDLPF